MTTLRQVLLNRRRALSHAECKAQATHFTEQLKNLTLLSSAATIGIYLAHQGELSLAPSIRWLKSEHKNLAAPLLDPENPHHLLFAPFTDNLIKNRYGIQEPPFNPEHMIPPTELEVVLLPLVGFNLQGFRLGMGQGYYDRTFAFRSHTKKPLLIGCGYAWQEITEPVSPNSWDIPLDAIVTDQKIHYVNRSIIQGHLS